MKGIGFYDLDFFEQKTDNSLLTESISRILLTSPGERLHNPGFGSNLRNFIFSSVSLEEIQEDIKFSIQRWEPRVTVYNVIIIQESVQSIRVEIELYNKETHKEFAYEVLFDL